MKTGFRKHRGLIPATLALILSAILILTTTAMAQEDKEGPFEDPAEGMGQRMPAVKCLDLTGEQADRVRKALEQHERATGALGGQLHQRRSELRLLWLQPKPAPDKIREKLAQVQDLQNQMQAATLDYWITFRAALTPEQAARFLAMGGAFDSRPASPHGMLRRDRRPMRPGERGMRDRRMGPDRPSVMPMPPSKPMPPAGPPEAATSSDAETKPDAK